MQLPDPEKPSPASLFFLPDMHEVIEKQNIQANIKKAFPTLVMHYCLQILALIYIE